MDLAQTNLLSWELDQDASTETKTRMSPHCVAIHEVFPHFDFTEIEADLQGMLYTDGDWVYSPTVKTERKIPITALSGRQQSIAQWWKRNDVDRPFVEPFILSWVDRRASPDDWHPETKAALP